MGRARVEGLRILDLTDAGVRAAIGVTEEELIADDLRLCQAIAAATRHAGFDGILSQSAAIVGELTLAVFRAAIDKVIREHDRVQRPPISIRHVVHRLRIHSGLARVFAAALRGTRR